jgi:sugar-specific transcriptional regulator TrmB
LSARDHAQRTARQYEAVEPENRLVAHELERHWEEAIGHKQHLQEEYARFRCERPPELTSREREAILRLAHDVPALWHAAETTPQDRQEIVRLLVDCVTVDVHNDSEQDRGEPRVKKRRRKPLPLMIKPRQALRQQLVPQEFRG